MACYSRGKNAPRRISKSLDRGLHDIWGQSKNYALRLVFGFGPLLCRLDLNRPSNKVPVRVSLHIRVRSEANLAIVTLRDKLYR